ncbi:MULTISPECIES: hypothetical protein [Aeromonas]|uniref:hypothetical protein n=1 Tax=Aeromonas TaxID=642 RepID=UPI000B1FBE5A|nr:MULTISPECIES: hypothetical protein [Aeromonas]HDK8695912.1 hypothetical protein [Aeromonas hydrophila]
MEETKKCEVAVGSGAPKSAVFHRWGDNVVYGDDGQPRSVTTAVVEYADGQVGQVEPSRVKFIK